MSAPGQAVIAIESVLGAWDEAQALLALHYEEVAADKQAIRLDPDRERYDRMEQKGSLIGLTARIDGVLIGYSVFFIGPHLHYKSTLVASNDILFVHRAYRETLVGLRLIRESERVLRERGVVRVTWHIKPHMDWSPILGRMSYKPLETVYGKLLTEASHGA